MPGHRLVAKFLNFLRRNAEPPHGVGHLADDAEVVAGTMKSHKDVGVFGGHRGGTMRRYVGGGKCPPSPKTHQRAFAERLGGRHETISIVVI